MCSCSWLSGARALLPLPQKPEDDIAAAAGKLHALGRISSADEQVCAPRPACCCRASRGYTPCVPLYSFHLLFLSGHMHGRAPAICYSTTAVMQPCTLDADSWLWLRICRPQ